MPQRGDVDVNNHKHGKYDNRREYEQNPILGINAHKKQNQKSNEEEIVDDHQEGNPQEGDEKALEDFGNGGDSG